MELIYVTVFGLIVGAIISTRLFKRVTIFEHERGLKYERGKFTRELEPGRYWYMAVVVSISTVDIRPRVVSISGQEILSSDGVTIKVSIAANYEIADVYAAVNKVQDYRESLYLILQLALRKIVGGVEIDTLLKDRNTLFDSISGSCKEAAKEIGLNLIDVNVKDIMFPGALKEMFAQVAKAKREGQAALERARGETASLRSLANAAKMLETNPYLMNLRLMQTISESSGNTFVVNASGQSVTLPAQTDQS